MACNCYETMCTNGMQLLWIYVFILIICYDIINMDGMNVYFYMVVCVLHSEIQILSTTIAKANYFVMEQSDNGMLDMFEKYRMVWLLDDHYDVRHRAYAMAEQKRVIICFGLYVFNSVFIWICMTKVVRFLCRSLNP